ncbi:MAG: tRNA lysidine(34) synthetase TilS [Lachnospiraceae bacterium]
MQDKVRRYITDHKLIAKHDKVLVGLSGGADSTALLLLLYELQEALSFEIVAVHVNHGIRGAEALRDEQQAAALCQRLQIAYESVYVDVPKLAQERKLSPEEAGRIARREIFEECAGRYGAAKIALAHHKNDLAETMLHNLARGSGLTGLIGIRPVHGAVIHPLLCVERSEIEAYLTERGQDYIQDSSNKTDAYTRNRIRHHVVPLLTQEINVQAVEHMAQTAGIMAEVERYLQKQADVLYSQYAYAAPKLIEFDEALFSQDKIMVLYVVRKGLEVLQAPQQDLGRVHFEQMIELAAKESGKSISLPNQLRARRGYRGVILEFVKNELHDLRPQSITVPGEYQYGRFVLTFSVVPYRREMIQQKKYTKCFDYGKIGLDLSVRTRQNGDFLIINETGRRKKLGDYFTDCKVPRISRDGIPLLTAGSEILWVIGYRTSENFHITVQTKEILVVSCTIIEETRRASR